MVTLIISILFWCMSSNKGLGIASIILSALGTCIDFMLVGWLCIIDVIILIVNICVYNAHHNERG